MTKEALRRSLKAATASPRASKPIPSLILAEYKTKSDITLAELKAKLAARGADVGIGTLWRFFDRRRITLKKRWRTRPSNSALM